MGGLHSVSASPLPGFAPGRPGKRHLLDGCVAVHADTLADALALLPDFTRRVRGLVLLPGDAFARRELAAELWEIALPPAWAPLAAALAGLLLPQMEQQRRQADRIAAQDDLLRRQGEHLELLRTSFDHKTGELVSSLARQRADGEARLRAEARLRQDDKMRSLGQLAGGIAHDFNNMICSIMGAAEMLQRELPDARARSRLDLILGAAERSAGLTRQLLAFTRQAPLQRQELDLHRLVQEAAGLLERGMGRNCRIQLRLEADRPRVQADASQLVGAVLNLGINAAQAMPAGGTITIATADRAVGPAGEQLGEARLAPGRHVAVRVIDTGGGIAAEDLPRIFEPFFTTKPVGVGTGMGLAAVYGTVLEHGGAVAVDSRLGEGSVFTLILPCLAEPALPAAAPSSGPAAAGAGGRLLLVIDDEESVRRIAMLFLEELGHQVLEAASGAAGLDLLRAHGEAIDGVLLDMQMPGMDGAACFRALRELRPRLPVLIVSGHADLAAVHDLRRASHCSFLAKPYRLGDFAAAVAGLLGRGASG
ncbi:MAG: response regulator [Planctomycetes bacterium]|nr:response regulator [Planctomycetota bacterium]